jgi:hypothetical protein
VLGFMDIGFALRGDWMLNDCPLNPGNSNHRLILAYTLRTRLQSRYLRAGSKPFDFKIDWPADEVRNVMSAFAASACLLVTRRPAAYSV